MWENLIICILQKVGFNISLQYSLLSGRDLTVCSHQALLFWVIHLPPARGLIAAHSLQHCQVLNPEFNWQLVLPSPNYNELCKPWVRPSTQGHLVCRTLYWWNPLPLADGQHYQSDQPCRHSSPLLWKYHKLTLWIQSRACLHEKGLHWLHADRRAIKASVSITTP